MPKLFIVCDGSHPEEFEGESLTECISKLLSGAGADAMPDFDLPDLLKILCELSNEVLDRLTTYSESWGVVTGIDAMFSTVQVCYGLDSWEECEKILDRRAYPITNYTARSSAGPDILIPYFVIECNELTREELMPLGWEPSTRLPGCLVIVAGPQSAIEGTAKLGYWFSDLVYKGA
jgi:hypothetical protein